MSTFTRGAVDAGRLVDVVVVTTLVEVVGTSWIDVVVASESDEQAASRRLVVSRRGIPTVPFVADRIPARYSIPTASINH